VLTNETPNVFHANRHFAFFTRNKILSIKMDAVEQENEPHSHACIIFVVVEVSTFQHTNSPKEEIPIRINHCHQFSIYQFQDGVNIPA
jgi:hypothetical protein